MWLQLAALEVVDGSRLLWCPVIKHLLDYVENCKNEHNPSHMSAKKLLLCTEYGHVSNIPTFGGAGLKYESKDWLSCVTFFVVYHRPSRKIHR
jgi:hypothetical protein